MIGTSKPIGSPPLPSALSEAVNSTVPPDGPPPPWMTAKNVIVPFVGELARDTLRVVTDPGIVTVCVPLMQVVKLQTVAVTGTTLSGLAAPFGAGRTTAAMSRV